MKKFLCLLLAAMMLLGCVPALAEGFPELDSFAAWDYIGDWFGVSGLNVMDEPTTDYPDLKLNLFLNGLGDLYLDDAKKEVVGWYVEEGTVFLARTVDKVPQADQIFAFAAKNETGRLVVNLGDCSVICEQEGEEYLDVTWPEFDAEDAKYFIGTWEAVTYISEGMELPAELVGPMTFVLKDDGTAQSIEGDEEPYDLRWYSDYAVAYIGENPMELAEISFDGNGNISVKLDAETTVIMKPVAEVIETGTILGTWESSDKTVEITEDGKLKMVYKSDGYTNHMQWEIIDGMPTVSLGTWKGSTIQFVDGYLIINYSVEQKLTRVGDVPEIYVGPGGFEVPADDASADFLGNWVEDDGRGVLTFNADFTAVMNFTDGRVYDMNWKTTDTGAMFTSGNWFDTPMVIEDENTLNIGSGWMILYREGTETDDSGDEQATAQPIGSEGAAYFGVWALESMMGMDASLFGATMDLYLNEDGTCSIFDGEEHDYNVWTMENGVAMIDGDALTINAEGKLVMAGEMEMIFVKKDDAASSTSSSTDVAYVPSVADDFIGGWICKADPNMQILLLEGEANLIDGGELYTVDWSVVDGVAEFDGMKLYITDTYTIGILDMYGEQVEFERGYVEKPKASAAAPQTDDSDEMSNEELLALLALFGQMEGGEGSSDLPEALQPYVGTWHMVYMATGGLEGDLRSKGLTAKLELNADGTGTLSGAADDSGKWYDDEGTVRFGKADTPLVLLDGGFLRYGSQLAGYMVFSQDETATWSPEPVVPVAPVAPAAPAGAGAVGLDNLDNYIGKKYVAKTYSVAGFTQDATALGYVFTIEKDGICELTMSGYPTLLRWVAGTGLHNGQAADAMMIDYMGIMTYYAFLTAEGIDLDMNGMLVHFVPVE